MKNMLPLAINSTLGQNLVTLGFMARYREISKAFPLKV